MNAGWTIGQFDLALEKIGAAFYEVTMDMKEGGTRSFCQDLSNT